MLVLFLWAGTMDDCTFPPSVGYVCVQCWHSEPVDVSLQTPFAYGAAVPSFALCTDTSQSCMPALIPFDFTVSCHFKRSLLIDIYWWPVINLFSSTAWGLSYAGSPLCSVLHKYMVNDRHCHRELKSL